MKTLLVGAAAMFLGVGGGAFVAGNRLKGEIVERLEAERLAEDHDSSGAETTPETHSVDPNDDARDSADVRDSADLPADPLDAGPGVGDVGTSGPEQPGLTQQVGRPSGGVPAAPAPDVAAGSTGAGGPAGDAGLGVDSEASRQLAKIFEAMRPEDAAAVLQGMEDSEVRGILLGMDERQAAAILGDFEAARAAALSRLVLQTAPEGG